MSDIKMHTEFFTSYNSIFESLDTRFSVWE